MGARLAGYLVGLAVIAGCSDNGAAVAIQQWEDRIAKSQHWKHVELSEPVGGVYRGTAVTAGGRPVNEGLPLEFEVRVDGPRTNLDWKVKGGQGHGSASWYEPK